jgi:uncharacterized protein YeaO (DUF488 family)
MNREENYRKKYEELQREHEELKQKYEETLRLVEALKKQLETVKKKKAIEIAYEEKSAIDTFILRYLGKRPSHGGGSTLRWELTSELIRKLFEEKEGDYHEFIRRFARMKGLTERKLEFGYIRPLIDDGVIEVYFGNEGLKWRWAGGKLWRQILKEAGKTSEEKTEQ